MVSATLKYCITITIKRSKRIILLMNSQPRTKIAASIALAVPSIDAIAAYITTLPHSQQLVLQQAGDLEKNNKETQMPMHRKATRMLTRRRLISRLR